MKKFSILPCVLLCTCFTIGCTSPSQPTRLKEEAIIQHEETLPEERVHYQDQDWGVEAMSLSFVCIDEFDCFSVEIADTREKRMVGLMNRESLPEKEGMIFIFEQLGAPTFWMKNTLIPLDMLWLDDAGTILHIEHMVPPCEADPCPSYGPSSDVQARYVLEINGGLIEEKGVAVGQKLLLDLE